MSKTYTVRSPHRYTGRVGKDLFQEGVCHHVAGEDLAYYSRHGYAIEENPTAPPGTIHTDAVESLPAPVPASVEDLADSPGPDTWMPSPADKKEAWATFAKGLGIEVEGLTKDEIIAAVMEKQETEKEE